MLLFLNLILLASRLKEQNQQNRAHMVITVEYETKKIILNQNRITWRAWAVHNFHIIETKSQMKFSFLR